MVLQPKRAISTRARELPPPRPAPSTVPPPPPAKEDPFQKEKASQFSDANWMRLIWIVLGLVLINIFIASLFTDGDTQTEIPYSVFVEQAESDNVTSIESTGEVIIGTFRAKVSYPADSKDTLSDFRTRRPEFATDDVVATLVGNGVEVSAKKSSSNTNILLLILINFGPAVLIIFGYLWLMRRASGVMGGIGSLGRSRAVRVDGSRQSVTFADVAGIDEAKEELIEVVDFLRDPSRYQALGARAPRGVLLMGAPGTGKTLLARAVAGEANVPFFSMSAAEFIEMIVGVGASRVRDLFNQAKAVAPSIVFIDELDAIGRTRGNFGAFGGVDEREQTLNQVLTEMDGFTANQGVIVLAATNRPDILDPALLRAGRFDRRVTINAPDQSGRIAILRVHTKSVPLAADADLQTIASTTPGMVGADIANLVNEAALMAARRGHLAVQLSDFTDALERILLGAERKIMLTEADRKRTAYHESGHALIGMLQEGADPVRKVSIIPHGRTLGVTYQSPTADRYGMSENYLRGRIMSALGGRVAEEIVFDDVTTGAESDLEDVTAIARQMVGRWGMSHKIGPMSVLPPIEEEVGYLATSAKAPSDELRQLVDAEARVIIDDCYARARETLVAHRTQLDSLARVLLEHETLEESEAYAAAGVEHPPRRPWE